MDKLREEIREYSEKALLIIKILALVSAIILLITFWSISKTNCDTCSFDLNNNKIGANELMKEYYNECLNHPLVQSFPLNPLNQHN